MSLFLFVRTSTRLRPSEHRYAHARRQGAPALLLLLAAALCAPPAPAAAPPPPVANALREAGIPQDSVAIVIQEIGAAKPALALRADVAMNPASVMKLVTSFVALEWLGPGFTWKTEAYLDGELKDGTLAGNLVLKGYGDPKITLENFWLLLRELRQKGLRDIAGDLVLDRSYFAANGYDPGRFDEQPLRAYNVGPDALLVNFKTVRFILAPDAENRRVAVRAEPPLAGLTVRNTLKFANAECGDWKGNARAAFASSGDKAEATFAGAYSLTCGEQNWYVSLMNHPGYVGGAFRQLWQEAGGTLSGQVKDGSATPAARLFATLTSPQLAEVVRDINKFSNNVMARQLFLTIDAQANGAPAMPARAAGTIRDWLKRRGLAFPELVMENGAGLSRIERISAEHLNQLLQSAFASPIMPEFVSSFSLTAVDGTMKKRLLGTGAAGQAHIKTGTLDGVRAAAGYVLDANGRRWTVVGMINHPNAVNAQPALDALVQWVANAAGR
ncbi:MAG: D-alanyl-D-alanine carboxypeptidase/D-alanyl-D-alanine-endopeptidase [Burkholderiales bacterium]|nr:D-alanyl-D-alanine carboxypeptidase/D-alanyl-D-alanine-endopeptidase [Burkholderiales bacterium]